MNLKGDSHGTIIGGRAALLLAIAMAFVNGCGESNSLSGVSKYPVKGKITLPDGKPLTSGTITLVGIKAMISATTNIESDGSFDFSAGGGVPEGEYKIRLEVSKGASPKQRNAGPQFPSKYLDEDGSDTRVTVKPDDSNNIDLKLTPNPTKSASGKSDQR